MTIRFPRKSIGDRILSRLRKRWVVSFPAEGIERYGVYVATKEPFLRALLRQKSETSKGMVLSG